MGVQESLNQVIAELANRRIQLRDTGDPNLDATIGTTILQTDSGPPMVTWRKNRAGANGWDLELLSPQQSPYTVYVDSGNTSPKPDGSVTNPYVTIQDALDAIGPAVDYDDFVNTPVVYVAAGYYTESPIIPAAREIIILLDGQSWVDGYFTITVNQALMPIVSSVKVSICAVGLSVTGGLLAFRPGINGINCNIVSPYTRNAILQIFGVNIWEMIDISVHPCTILEYSKIQISDSYIGGKDIGGGVWKAINAPYSNLFSALRTSFAAEVDIYSFLKAIDCCFYDFQVRNRWLPYWGDGSVGLIETDVQGIVTTPISSTVKCLPCDRYTMHMFDWYLRYGYVTVNLAHIFEFHEMWCNEVTVNTGAAVVLDSFPIGSGSSCVWEVNIYRGTTQFRRSQIGAVWTSAGSINSQGEIKFGDIGDTSSITLSVDVSGGTTVRLTATSTVTNTWKVRVLRNITHAYNPGL